MEDYLSTKLNPNLHSRKLPTPTYMVDLEKPSTHPPGWKVETMLEFPLLPGPEKNYPPPLKKKRPLQPLNICYPPPALENS